MLKRTDLMQTATNYMNNKPVQNKDKNVTAFATSGFRINKGGN